MALHTNKDSAHIMHLIRKNTIGAEIGVWMGNTSTQFLKKGLKKFYMVDPYSVEPYKNSSEKSSFDNARFFKDNLVQIPIDLNFSEVEWLNKNKLEIKSNTIKHFINSRAIN